MKQLSILFILISIISCSDNPSGTDNVLKASDFFPLSIGNYWVYEYVELNKKREPVGDVSIDSSVIVGTRNFMNKTFHTVLTYRNNSIIDTSWYHTDNLRINQIANAGKTGIQSLDDTLFKMVELYSPNWLIMLIAKDSAIVKWEDEYHITNSQFRYNGYRNYGGDTVEINSEQHITMSFRIVFDAINYFRDTSGTVLINYQPAFYYYKKNIGPIMIQKEPYSISERDNPNNIEYHNGWRRQLLRTNLE